MEISCKRIDGGALFDFGKTSKDYAKYRDIYPEEFYEKIISLGLCTKGQKILDVGTGTGVLPRNMQKYGGDWTGTDIAENQINEAKVLTEKIPGAKINYLVSTAENLNFPDQTFDVITACQCFWYFDYTKTSKEFSRILKTGGKLLLLCMEWLPSEDKIAGASENLILKYNPAWTGKGAQMKKLFVPAEYKENFKIVKEENWKLSVHFTREKWNGRMKTSRGIGASLPPEKIAEWEKEHMALLEKIAPKEFDILHYAAFAELEKL